MRETPCEASLSKNVVERKLCSRDANSVHRVLVFFYVDLTRIEIAWLKLRK
jgi:hypothetical protein